MGGLHDLCGTDCAVCWLFAMMLFLGLFVGARFVCFEPCCCIVCCVVFEYADWICLVVVGLLFWLVVLGLGWDLRVFSGVCWLVV